MSNNTSPKNSNFSKAKNAKNDEFYTQYHDIEKEMQAYLDFDPNVFRDKTILLPCDDPEWSNFTKFFAQNFERFGIKELISTSYAHSSKHLNTPYTPSLFESTDKRFDEDKSYNKGKIFRLRRDINGDSRINIDDLEWAYLNDDGDFRSQEITALRDQADIIITNPPFSLFREFLAWIVEAEKQFAIIGNKNAITYKEVFPLIKDNKIWSGAMPMGADILFRIPKAMENDFVENKQEGSAYRFVENELMARATGMWFTNIEHGRRHQPLQLMTMADNLKFNKKIQGKAAYQKYDNYDAIEVPLTIAIPSDYTGVMGVPISFLDKYNPEQFEILSANDFRCNKKTREKPHGLIKDKDGAINGKPTYARILIKHKNPTQGAK
ncbi:DNA methyltransferase [Haemophilus parainfluenzae]|uniref:DNA methyltransferase n=1 Tax=Haemophilus parainfluenzae TaxID=729 RepID=A0AB36E7D3_HAEPA|nr:adenine-specific methyltransferase EcoRI family protein [Haemophilus parainfluenzae]OBY50705.1 DNA methyltransferase [Haemophilus parainfluenzae]